MNRFAQPCRDARDGAFDDDPDLAALGLPQWDFTGLYPEPADDAIEADFQRCETEAKAFAERYEGKLATLSGDALAEAIALSEAMSETLGRIMLLHLSAQYAQQVTDPARAKRHGRQPGADDPAHDPDWSSSRWS